MHIEEQCNALWNKYSIESDETFTECIERTIDGWKTRAEKAEAEVERFCAGNVRFISAYDKLLSFAEARASDYEVIANGLTYADARNAVREIEQLQDERDALRDFADAQSSIAAHLMVERDALQAALAAERIDKHRTDFWGGPTNAAREE